MGSSDDSAGTIGSVRSAPLAALVVCACLVGCGGAPAAAASLDASAEARTPAKGPEPADASVGHASHSDAGHTADAGREDSAFAVEAGQDAARGVDASTFVVGNVTGLSLWLDAAKGVTLHGGNYVRYWADQSGNHNDGIAGEPHPAEEPVLVDSSINGLPALHFNPGPYGGDSGIGPNCDGENCGAGDNFMIMDSPSLQWGTGDFLIEVVGRYTNSDPASPEYTYAGSFFFRSGTNGPWFRGNAYPTTPSTGLSALLSSKEGHDINELVTSTTGYNDGKFRLMAMQRVGTVVSIRVNGVETDTRTFATALDVTGTTTRVDGGDPCSDGVCITIGASYSDVSRLEGDIAELVAISGTLAPADLRGVEGYLMSKYAL